MTLETILAHFEQNQAHLSFPERLHTAIQQLVQLTPEIPHPAHGRTYQRWQILAQVAATDLNLVKWFESHLDALSILQELGQPVSDADAATRLWAVWAAEGSQKPICFDDGLISGEKTWCSAASLVGYGLMTYRNAQQQSQLLLVDMQQANIDIDTTDWQAVGMQHTQTAKITFENVVANKIANPDDYLSRAGFWHGAAGVAACWYGAAVRLAAFLQQACDRQDNHYRLMYLGQVNTQLATVKHSFQQLAQQIDAVPSQSHELAVRILRANVEQAALQVLDQVGKALGARPFCDNEIFARLAADLPVFLRQSHAAHDLEHIGKLSVQEHVTWML
ncbi:MAG: acyl-CoA dehydrogenase [Moraxellaceae bacterium]|nr:MAG: acyl-CoA dehydrogenase [Moraxellaceae bacterium]